MHFFLYFKPLSTIFFFYYSYKNITYFLYKYILLLLLDNIEKVLTFFILYL
jgi:hypothetical protein